jgi:sugar phosphate permease
MQLRRPTASQLVLSLLCLMYLITYVDRVNIATAANEIKRELALSNTQLAFILSAFGYPYVVFQIFGGWVGDRVGARRTLFLCGLIWASATILTGFTASIATLFLVRLLIGVGEGATFPVATRAMQAWTPAGRRGFAQGVTHAFARLGNALTPPVVAWLIGMVTWRGSFVVLGCLSMVWVFTWVWYFRDVPAEHPSMTRAELERLPNAGRPATSERAVVVPWRRLAARMWPVSVVYFCYGWTLWMYLNWLPSYFLHEHKLQLGRSALFSSMVFAAGVGGDYLGGVVSDAMLRNTGDLRIARCRLVRWI